MASVFLAYIDSDNSMLSDSIKLLYIEVDLSLATVFSEISSKYRTFLSRNTFENVVCNIAAILFMFQCVK